VQRLFKLKEVDDHFFFALEEKCEKFSGRSFLTFFYVLKKSKMWYNFRDYIVNLVYDLK